MHIRLKEYQEKEESRLNDANKHVAKFVAKPSPNREFEAPIFTDKAVDRALGEMNWVKRRNLDETLESELAQLEQQIDLSVTQKRGYEHRKAQVYLLKGAVAAARGAGKDGAAARHDDNVHALEYFQKAFKLSNKKDPDALEYIGHQQVRLSNQDAALETFEQLERMQPTEGPEATLRQARALKFQAEVYEWKRRQPNLVNARKALIAALKILPESAPHLERAEIHEMYGRVREKQKAFNKATLSYSDAEGWYLKVVDNNRSDVEDVQIAKAGLKRLRDALDRLQRPTVNDEGISLRAPEPPPPDASQAKS
jgi:tetratricopeptide (TPR) repeat protein